MKREILRDKSKRVFNNSYMLEVCLAIAQASDRICLTQLLGDSGLSPSIYSGPISRLADLGLLVDARRPSDDHRARWYSRAPSSLWTAATELTGRDL